MTSRRVSDLVAAHIQRERTQRDWSARTLAARLTGLGAPELSASVIANIESGRRDANGRRRRDVTVDEWLAMACALDVPPADLLGTLTGWDSVAITTQIDAAPGDVASWLTDRLVGVTPSLLGGMAFCESCSRPVMARREDGSGEVIYYCAHSDCPGPKVRRSSVWIDAYVSGVVLARMNRADFIAAISRSDPAREEEIGRRIGDLRQQRRKTEKTLENLADYPGVDPDVLARSLASFTRQISELESELSGLEAASQVNQMIESTGLDDYWDDLPLSPQRSTINLLMQVTLMPVDDAEPPFDPSSVKIHWKAQRRGPEEKA